MTKRLLLITCLGCFLNLITSCDTLIHKNHYLFPKQCMFRFVTYNIYYGKGPKKIVAPQTTLLAILKTNADILLIQEYTNYWKNYLTPYVKSQFPYQEYKLCGSYGFAIFSKYPFKTLVYTDPKIGWHPGWIILADTPLGPVQIANLHLSPPIKSETRTKTQIGFLYDAYYTSRPVRLKEIQYYYSRLNPTINSTIIAGDFNENNMGRAVKFLRTHGFLDAIQVSNFTAHTWFWQKGCFVLTEQLDHVFYTPNLTLANVQVLHEGDSDHFPLIVDFIK